jgi:ABC-type proline/glycine betaine transport system permease subunit
MGREVAPYVAVALQPSFRGATHRSEIKRNIESIAVLMGAAVWLSAEYPVRLVALPEGVLQGFDDEIVLVLWTGLGLTTRLVLVAISGFFPVFFNTSEGVRSLDPALARVGHAYGCTRREQLAYIVLPHTLPFLLTGLQLAVGRGLVVVVIAEIFVGSLGGIGYFIITAGQQFQSADVFAGALLMAVTGCVLTLALERLRAWLTPWSRSPAL